MRLVLLGAPGSGKGTQAARLKDHLQVPHVSTGDLLRAEVKAGSPLGRQAKEVMARGDLVSDEILLGMLEDRFSRDDRSEEHTSELQSLMRISYAVFCLKKKNKHITTTCCESHTNDMHPISIRKKHN